MYEQKIESQRGLLVKAKMTIDKLKDDLNEKVSEIYIYLIEQSSCTTTGEVHSVGINRDLVPLKRVGEYR
jgi:hypothetical protein